MGLLLLLLLFIVVVNRWEMGRIILFSTASRPALKPIQLPIQWAPATVSPGVKLSGREADH
jgi:hypothetical protein